jgi:hypothetical protein
MWDSRAQAGPMATALMAIAPSVRDEPKALASGRANAIFVAHLIATAAQVPQTRARRRAEPDDASAAYRALGQWPSEAGGLLSRSL